MTESRDDAAGMTVLRQVARASGHELRNALNALAVNVEVIRARSPDDPGLRVFVEQAVQQLEESVRLAESAIALIGLLLEALGGNDAARPRSVGGRSVQLASTEEAAARAARMLQPLAARTGMRAETRDASVILTTPESSG